MNELRVRDLMTTQVITVRPTDTVKQAVTRMAIDSVSAAPVTDNRSHLVGIVSQTDVLKLILRYQRKLEGSADTGTMDLLDAPMDGMSSDEDINQYNKEISDTKVADIMTSCVMVTTPDAKIVDALAAMMKTDVGRLPVVEKGVLIGTLSREDILFYIYKRKARGRQMLEVHVLASGSDGNCTVVRLDDEAVMIDAGLSYKATKKLMDVEGVDGSEIKALLLTHEHSDHTNGAGAVCRRLDIPMYCTTGTLGGFNAGKVDYRRIETMQNFSLCGFDITPLPTSHNAADPNAFLLRSDEGNVLVATDTGKLTYQCEEALAEANIAVIEANYDAKMLREGPYPPQLKRLIASDRGHLCNTVTAKAIKDTRSDDGWRKIFLAHLSKTNNIPDLAREEVSAGSGIPRFKLDCLEFPGDTRTIKRRVASTGSA